MHIFSKLYYGALNFPFQESIVSKLIMEGADQRKIVVGLQMSANTFSLSNSKINTPSSVVSGPGENSTIPNDFSSLAYYEVRSFLKFGSNPIKL